MGERSQSHQSWMWLGGNAARGRTLKVVMENGLEREKRGYSTNGGEGAEVLTPTGAESFNWAAKGTEAFKNGLCGREEGNLCFRGNWDTGKLP